MEGSLIRAYCGVKSKRSGRQCKNLAGPSGLCKFHAGQAKEKAQ